LPECEFQILPNPDNQGQSKSKTVRGLLKELEPKKAGAHQCDVQSPGTGGEASAEGGTDSNKKSKSCKTNGTSKPLTPHKVEKWKHFWKEVNDLLASDDQTLKELLDCQFHPRYSHSFLK
jgi:hypothetical protein